MQIKIVSVNLKLLKNLFTWFKLKNISKNALFTLILAQKSIAEFFRQTANFLFK